MTQVAVLVLPLNVSGRTQVPIVSAGQGFGEQVSPTWVQVPRLHAYEQLPVYPLAQLPELWPLFVGGRTQLLVVSAAQGFGAQVLVTDVKVPRLHA